MDSLDKVIAENMKDPEFAEAYKEEQKINKSLQDEEKTELTKIALDYYDEKNILPKKPRGLTEEQKIMVRELIRLERLDARHCDIDYRIQIDQVSEELGL